MASFSNVNNTLATIDVGFSYANYASTLLAAADSVSRWIDTISSAEPAYSTIEGQEAWLAWSDETYLRANLSSIGTSSATVSGFDVYGSEIFYGPISPWLDAEGTGKIGFNANREITSASVFSLKTFDFGAYTDDGAGGLTFVGSMKLNFDNGSFSGKATSVTMKWLSSDFSTWEYVTLKGSISLGNESMYGTGLSGKITGIEWGTALPIDFTDEVKFIPEGSASGLKLDAASAMNALAVDGFAGLSASIYSGNDTVTGTTGNDYLDASTGNDKVNGGDGHDEIYGGAGNDQLTGGAGDDYINGGAGNDKISDDSGNNIVIDEEGKALITLGSGGDIVITGAGNDKIVVGDGMNSIDSGAGNDNISAGAGDDWILGGDGNDKITAGDGWNWVKGDEGNDVIVTGNGNDYLNGGDGADKLTGGGGSDAFVFDNIADPGKDTIMDFDATLDFIAFDTTVFGSLSAGIAEGNVVKGKLAIEADDYLIFDTQGGKLYYDADGNGGQAAVQIAIIKGAVSNISASNFIDEALLFA